MKSLIIAFILASLCIGCQSSGVSAEDQPQGSAFQAARLWNNGLPADGCDYRISLNVDGSWVEYGPDANSRKRIEQFVLENLDFANDYHGYKEVKVKAVTNKSLVTVACGWGGSKQLPGISVTEIQK